MSNEREPYNWYLKAREVIGVENVSKLTEAGLAIIDSEELRELIDLAYVPSASEAKSQSIQKD